MPRVAKSKSAPVKDSTATIGFEAKLWLTADKLRSNMDAAEPSGARQTATGSPQGERGGVHQFGVPPMTAGRHSANTKTEGKPQVVSEAKDNIAGFVIANGSMSSNQSGEGDIGQNQLRNGSRPPIFRFYHN